MDSIYWLLIFIVFLVIEIITLGLTTIWFAGGALVAFILALFKVHVSIQIIAFFIVSILLVVLVKPIAGKHFNNHLTKTNVEALVGKTARVTVAVDNMSGQGKAVLDGNEWMARSINDALKIPADTLVVVRDIKGIKLIVDIKKEEI